MYSQSKRNRLSIAIYKNIYTTGIKGEEGWQLGLEQIGILLEGGGGQGGGPVPKYLCT